MWRAALHPACREGQALAWGLSTVNCLISSPQNRPCEPCVPMKTADSLAHPHQEGP